MHATTIPLGICAFAIQCCLGFAVHGQKAALQQTLYSSSQHDHPAVHGTKFVIDDSSCSPGGDQTKKAILAGQAFEAIKFIGSTKGKFTADNAFIKAFWAADSFTPAWFQYGEMYISRMSDKINPPSQEKVAFTCNDQTDLCQGKGKAYINEKVIAHASAADQTINFCEKFFSWFKNANEIDCTEGKVLEQYDSRVRVILHELAHLDLAKGMEKDKLDGIFADYKTENPAIDVPNLASKDQAEKAYGVDKCKSLAKGELWFYPPKAARVNADNWGWITYGNGIQASCADKLKNPAFEVPVVKARSLEDL